MKTDIPVRDRTYPYVGVCRRNDMLVLFTHPDEGIVIREPMIGATKLGEVCEDWAEDIFDVTDEFNVDISFRQGGQLRVGLQFSRLEPCPELTSEQ